MSIDHVFDSQKFEVWSFRQQAQDSGNYIYILAEIISAKKIEKYRALENRYVFCPVAAETIGPIDEGSLELLSEIGRRLTEISGEPRENQFIFQRFSIILHAARQCSIF